MTPPVVSLIPLCGFAGGKRALLAPPKTAAEYVAFQIGGAALMDLVRGLNGMKIIRPILKSWKEYLLIIAGSLIAAVSINVFLVPFKISSGGVSGIATMVYYLSGQKFPVGATVLALNIPLFIAGYRFLGGRFAFRTLFCIVFFSLFLNATAAASFNFAQLYLVKYGQTPSNPDLFLYSLFGGFLMGAGLGIVFKSGATTGGTDIVAKIIGHFNARFTTGQALLFIEASIVIFAAVSFRSFLLALYAIVTLFVQSKVIDAMLEGVNFAKAVFIISDRSSEIADRIMGELERGVTALNGTGMYTNNEKKVLLCVLHRDELSALNNIVKTIDIKAFVILTDIREVLGEGFKTYD